MTCLTPEQIEILVRGEVAPESAAELRQHCEQCEACRRKLEQALASLRSIEQDMRCVICDYNLRGLATDCLCPECGTPIARSIHGDLLKFAEPAWLHRLVLGVWFMLLQVLLIVLLGTGINSAASPWRGLPAGLIIAIIIVGSLGMMLLTTPERRTVHQQKALNLRNLVRVAAAVGLVGAACRSLVWLGAGFPLRFVAVVAALAAGCGVVILLAWLRRLAMRVPDDRLRRSTTIVIWGLSIGGLIAIIGTDILEYLLPRLLKNFPAPGQVGTDLAVRSIARANFLTLVMVVRPLLGLPLFIFGIGYVVVLLRFKAAFRRAAAQAQDEPAAGTQARPT